MHHAVAAGDVDTRAGRSGRGAAREAARAGSHRQALAHLEAVVPHAARLAPAEQAAVLDDYGWELYNAAPLPRGGEAGQRRGASSTRASAIRSRWGRASCACRATGSWPGETDAAEECAERAVRILEAAGDDAALAQATLYQGAILALDRRPRAGRGRAALAPAAWRGRRSAWTSPRCA